MRNIFLNFCLILTFAIGLTACQNRTPTLKVAATSVPHAELLERIKPALQAQQIQLEIIVVDDFNLPNRALADHEVDANFFQHLPFLEAQQKDFGYKLESLVAVHLEPMALYSKKHQALADLKAGSRLAIPSDPTNQARALALCEQVGLIHLKRHDVYTTLLDITQTNGIEFIEIDSPLLSRTLEEVDAAAISTNFALQAQLSPVKEALAIENAQSRFVNLVVVREGESQRKDLQALKAALTTEQMRLWLEKNYQGAIIPAF